MATLTQSQSDLQSPNHSSQATHLIELYPAPIGIFDSGVGGLSVYMHLKQQLPNEHYLYYADTLHVPYGPRSSAEIRQLTLTAVDWLVASGCKLVVIACNSASAHGLQSAREKHPNIPIVGLVPALKPAVLDSSSKCVAVLATQATLDGELLNAVISDYALPAQVNVVKWFDPDLVPWVEAGMPLDSETPKRLKSQLRNFAQQQVDHLVLGCTHYPFFRDFVMQQVAEDNLGIKVVDSGAAIADRVKSLLQQQSDAQVCVSQTAEVQESVSQKASVQTIEQPLLLINSHSKPIHSAASFEDKCIAETDSGQSYSGLYIGHSKQGFDWASSGQSKLSFFVSDPKADLAQVSRLVQRLIYR